jgi:hypothetical protein
MLTKLASLTFIFLRPGDPVWDAARLAWNLTADQQPEAMVHMARPGQSTTRA